MADAIAHMDVPGTEPSAERATDTGETPAAPARVPLGALLTGAGLITEEQLEEALQEGAATGLRIGEVVVARGWVTEDAVAKLLAEQWQLGYVDRASIWFDADALARMSREQAQRLEALPTRVQDGRVVVAVAEPTESRLAALREVIGDDTVVVVVPKSALDAGLRSDLLAGGSRTESRAAAAPSPEPADEAREEHAQPEQPEAWSGASEQTPPAEPEVAPPIAFPIRAISVAEEPGPERPAAPPPDELVLKQHKVTLSSGDHEPEVAQLIDRVQEAVSEASTLQQQAASLADSLARVADELAALAAGRDADRRRIDELEQQLGQRTELTEQLRSHLGDLTRTLEKLD